MRLPASSSATARCRTPPRPTCAWRRGRTGRCSASPSPSRTTSTSPASRRVFGCCGEFPPPRPTPRCVRRLRAAGAVIVGKTNTPELGQWPFTEGPGSARPATPGTATTRRAAPRAGAAAAVSAGLVRAALGSDGAGSVRIPAAWTGLVGIKPQRGRISTWPDPEAFYGLTCIGPLARTVQDAANLLDAARGNVAGDRHKPPAPAEPYARRRAAAPTPAACASRCPSASRSAAHPPVSTPRCARASRHSRDARGPRPRGHRGRPQLRPRRRRLHAPRDGRHPRVGRAGPRPGAARPPHPPQRPGRPRPRRAAARLRPPPRAAPASPDRRRLPQGATSSSPRRPRSRR